MFRACAGITGLLLTAVRMACSIYIIKSFNYSDTHAANTSPCNQPENNHLQCPFQGTEMKPISANHPTTRLQPSAGLPERQARQPKHRFQTAFACHKADAAFQPTLFPPQTERTPKRQTHRYRPAVWETHRIHYIIVSFHHKAHLC